MQKKNIFFILVIEILEVILTSEGKEKQVVTKAMLINTNNQKSFG